MVKLLNAWTNNRRETKNKNHQSAKTSRNRLFLRLFSVRGSRTNWWLASPSASNTTNFCNVNNNGNANNNNASNSFGVAPGFCDGGL